jgi:hypothetical protein
MRQIFLGSQRLFRGRLKYVESEPFWQLRGAGRLHFQNFHPLQPLGPRSPSCAQVRIAPKRRRGSVAANEDNPSRCEHISAARAASSPENAVSRPSPAHSLLQSPPTRWPKLKLNRTVAAAGSLIVFARPSARAVWCEAPDEPPDRSLK